MATHTPVDTSAGTFCSRCGDELSNVKQLRAPCPGEECRPSPERCIDTGGHHWPDQVGGSVQCVRCAYEPPPVPEPEHTWTARQVIEAYGMLRAVGNGELLDPSLILAWVEDNHPGPKAHLAALREAGEVRL